MAPAGKYRLRAVTGAGSSFTAALGAEGRGRLAALGNVRRYRTGSVLFMEGDRGGDVLTIQRGRLKITTATRDGRELVLGIRGPGELVGELASLDDGRHRRSATVVALDDVVVRVVQNDQFLHFVENEPHALLALTRAVIGRLHDADRRRAEFGAYDTLGRLARVLDELADAHGQPTPEGICVDPPLTQSEIAGLIGASRESVVRALGELRRREIIETGRRRLIVRDPVALRRLSR